MTLMSVQADTAQFRFGTQSLKVTTGDTGDNAIYPSSEVTVDQEESFSWSAFIKTNASITDGQIELRIAQGGAFTPLLGTSEAVTDTSEGHEDGWQRVVLTVLIPSGVTSVRPFIVYTGTTAGQVFWLDGVKFEKGDKASVWQENIVSPRTVLDQMGLMVNAVRGGILRLIGAAGGTRDTVQLGDHGLVFGSDTEIYSPAVDIITLPKLRVSEVADVSLSSTDHSFQIGPDSGVNMGIEADEIQARNNGAASDLFLNNHGGSVVLGGTIRQGGTSFPSPTINDLYYRTDHDMWFVYDGTRWLCTCPHEQAFVPWDTQPAFPLTASASIRWAAAMPNEGMDIYLEKLNVSFFVESGGSALDASNNWNGAVIQRPSGTGAGSVAIDSGSSNSYRRLTADPNTVIDLTGSQVALTLTWTKTGTPGNLRFAASVSYRYVAT